MKSEYCAVNVMELQIPKEEIYRTMGYGEVTPDDDICQLVDQLLIRSRNIAKPSYYYQIIPCDILENSIKLDDTTFNTENTITKLLKRSEQVAVFVATAGKEFQKLLDETAQSDHILELFVLDAIGSTLVEAVGEYMEKQLENDLAGLKHTNRFSPGYCAWNINEQHKLFALLPNNICEITLSESSLMHPIKSISGVLGIGPNVITKKYGCSICKNKDCYLRKN